MKIVIDARFWGPRHTGLGRYTEALVTSLHQLKPDHEISLLVLPKDKRRVHRAVPRFNLVHCSARPYSLQEQWQIPRLLDSINPDLVHFLHFNVPVFYSGRFLVTIHDLIKHHSTGLATTTRPPLSYSFNRLGYRLVINRAINRASQIIVPSNWVKKDILDFYSIPAKKIKVIPEASAPVYLKQSSLKPLTFKLAKPYLIYVGNAYPHKNLIQLIKVIKKINQNLPLKLVVVTGRGVFYQRLRQQIRKLKAQPFIRLKSFTPDKELKLLYQHALAFIIPSLLEGFGLPGLEAMASGTLVLASDRSCLPEVYGRSAFYFNPLNPDNIITKITKVLNLSDSKRQSLIKTGYQHASRFNWQKTASQTLKLYNL